MNHSFCLQAEFDIQIFCKSKQLRVESVKIQEIQTLLREPILQKSKYGHFIF